MKRAFLFVAIVSILSATVVFGIDTAIYGYGVMQRKAEADRQELVAKIEASRRFTACVKEYHPTLKPLIASVYVDSRTGTKYDIAGTEAWNECKAR